MIEPIKPTAKPARDASGRFTKGGPGGPGRKPRDTEKRWLELLRDCVTEADWREVIQAALTDAKAGNHRARDFLAKFLIEYDLVERIEQLEQALSETERPYGF